MNDERLETLLDDFSEDNAKLEVRIINLEERVNKLWRGGDIGSWHRKETIFTWAVALNAWVLANVLMITLIKDWGALFSIDLLSIFGVWYSLIKKGSDK
jgi:hypothetical protein